MSAPTPEIAIIGAGFGGIAVAVALRRAGIESFTMFERASTPGGTWSANRYPGAEVDMPSVVYSYSFKAHECSRTHASADDLRDYLDAVIDEYALRSRIRLDTTIERVVWDQRTARHTLVAAGGETSYAHVVVSAVGLLSEPHIPDWPGLPSFLGPVFHTGCWEDGHDLRGRTIAVVGTGASAAQVIPSLAEDAARLLVFQREPAWVVPKETRELLPPERAALRHPARWRIERLRQHRQINRFLGTDAVRAASRQNESLRVECEEHLMRHFAHDKPLRDALTPHYPPMAKRPVFSSAFYPALLRENVELIAQPVVDLTPTGIVDADRVERRVDAVIMATGFRAASFLDSLDVVGRDGVHLHDAWSGEPAAFLGIVVPGFPNFFILNGPNTNEAGAVPWVAETQADYVVSAVTRMIRHRLSSLEVKPAFFALFNRWVQADLRKTVLADARNHYTAPSGKIVTNWPRSPYLYWAMTRALRGVACTASAAEDTALRWTR